MNKFEALKMFQTWPPEHQRLCAEYWIETAEVEPTQAQRTFGERLSVSPIPLDQHKIELTYPREAAKVAAPKPTKKPLAINSRESTGFTLEELKYAQNGIAVGIKDCLLAEDMGRRFGRTKKAFQNYISLIHRNGIDLSTGRKKPHGVQY